MKSAAPISASPKRTALPAVVDRSAQSSSTPPLAARQVPSRAACACGGSCPRCERAPARRPLPLAAPLESEASEREAVAIARQVVGMSAPPDPPPSPSTAHHPRPRASARQPTRDPVAPSLSRHAESRPRAPPGASPRYAHTIRATSAPSASLDAGFALSDPLRSWFEVRFQTDFSAVRLHRGPVAFALCEQTRSRAFAFGNHLVLGRDTPSLDSRAGLAVLAHELTHIIQQASAPHPRSDRSAQARPRGPPSRESALQIQHRTPTLGIQCLGWDTLESAAGTVADFGSGVVGTVADAGTSVIGYAADGFASVVDYFAPGLLAFLRGGAAGQLNELFCSGLDLLIGTLIDPLTKIDFVSALESTFTSLTEGVNGLVSGLGAGASAVLGSLMRPLVRALSIYGDPILRGMSAAADAGDSIFSSLWSHLAVPVIGFLESAGGAAWAGFSGIIEWLERVSAPLRSVAAEAWEWLCGQFNLAWESTAGIRKWLSDTASGLWEAFLETIEPIKAPLVAVAGALILLSPLGPIVVLSQVVPPICEKIVWLWNNWNAQDILVSAREILANEILPSIIAAAGRLVGAIAGAASWLASTVTSITGAFSGLLGAFGASHCLRSVSRVLTHFADEFTRLGDWAQMGFPGLGEAISGVFSALSAIVRPILDFLVRLILVAANPPMLPVAITAAIWLLCPDDLKPPVIQFVLDFVLQFLRLAASFLRGLGPLVPIMKAAAIGFLQNVRGQADSLKIDASNKIAGLMAGAGIQFIAGYAVGLLEGLLDGILDPFRLIWTLIQFISRLCRSLGDYLAPLAFSADPRLGASVARFNAGVREGMPTERPVAAAESPGPGSILGPTATAPPTADGSLQASAANDTSDDTAIAELMGGATRSDADIIASLSPGVAGELTASAGELDAVDAEGATGAEMEARAEGSSVAGLAGLLGGIWDAILSGASNLGSMAADALLRFILLRDYQLGSKIGYVCGLILLEVIVAYFSGGASVQLKAAQPFIKAAIRFLDLGGEILGLLGRAVGRIRGPLLRGLTAVGERLGRFRFLQPMIQRIRRAIDPLLRFGDEAAEGARRLTHHADEAADTARAGRRAEDAAGAGRHADDVPQVSDAAARTGGPTQPHGNDAARAALKAAEMPAALAASRAICEANDRIDTPPPIVWAELMGLRSRFSWIETFRMQPKATPGHYEIHMIASDTVIDQDYTFFRIGAEDMDELISFWRQRVKSMKGQRRAEADAYLRRLREARRRGTPSRIRPTWWQTEAEVAHFYDEAGDALGTMANRSRRTRDVPYINGRDAKPIRRSDGTIVRDDFGRPVYERGHTRPDLVQSSHAIEVKNYRLTEPGDVDRLARTLENQMGDRGALHVGSGRGRGGLPADISHQAVIIDARGQNLSDGELLSIADRLISRINRRLDDLVAGGQHAVNRQRFTRGDFQFIVDGTLKRSQSGPAPASIPASVMQVLSSSGHSLPPNLQHGLEAHFHADLSHVRLHSGPLASQSAGEINAHAYTRGHDIVLGSGHNDFTAIENRRLLAHEIAHTLQTIPSTATDGAFVSDQSSCEQEARDTADRWIGSTDDPISSDAFTTQTP